MKVCVRSGIRTFIRMRKRKLKERNREFVKTKIAHRDGGGWARRYRGG